MTTGRSAVSLGPKNGLRPKVARKMRRCVEKLLRGLLDCFRICRIQRKGNSIRLKQLNIPLVSSPLLSVTHGIQAGDRLGHRALSIRDRM